jgi:hypothetical protein
MKEIHRRKASPVVSSSTTNGSADFEREGGGQRGGGGGHSSPASSKARRTVLGSLLLPAWTLAALAVACLVVAAVIFSSRNGARSILARPGGKQQQGVRNVSSGGLKKTKEEEDVEYHVIFSTGCTTIQDWQSYVFFYYAMVSGQPGTITRIASGCSDEDQVKLQTYFDEKIAVMVPEKGRFRIHFTPDYSRLKPGPWYKYFNKPFGTKHWLEHALGFPDNPINEDAIVILMDPDQIILRPFRNNDFSNTKWMDLPPGQTAPRTRVEHGKPMGQRYGFGLDWKRSVNQKKLLGEGVDSPLLHLTDAELASGYAVGPPYIATARDMHKIATQWSEFVVPIHDQYPELLAEMFAYCHAAAHLGLPHQNAARCVFAAFALVVVLLFIRVLCSPKGASPRLSRTYALFICFVLLPSCPFPVVDAVLWFPTLVGTRGRGGATLTPSRPRRCAVTSWTPNSSRTSSTTANDTGSEGEGSPMCFQYECGAFT